MRGKCVGWILCFLWCCAVAISDSLSSEQVAKSAITTTEIFSKDTSYYIDRQLLQSGDQPCNSEILWYTCLHLGCGVNVESDVYESVMGASCTFNEIRRMWDCGEIYIDSYTHDALVEGVCTQACEPQKLACEIFSRSETPNNVPIPSSECRDGEVTLEFNCDCDIVSRSEMLEYAPALDGSRGGCSAVCSEFDRDLSECDVNPANSQTDEAREGCAEMICLHENCAAQISRAAVDIVKTSSCTFSLVTRMWECEGALEIDGPGYEWARQGSCVDACSIVFRPDSCLFQARYGKHPEPPLSQKKKKKRKRSKKIKITGKVNSRLIPKKRDSDLEDKSEDASEGKIEKEAAPETLSAENPPSIEDVQIEEDAEDDYEVFAAEYQEAYDGYYDEYQYHDYTAGVSAKEEETEIDRPDLAADPIAEDDDPPIVSESISESRNETESFVRPTTTRIEAQGDVAPSPQPIEEFEIGVGPWMPCRQSCDHPSFGDNVQERFVVCRSAITGLPVARDLCPSTQSESIRACPAEMSTGRCDGSFVYKYQDWSECSIENNQDNTCSRNRGFDCYETLEDGSLFPTTEERCSSLVRDPNEISCDWRQCNQVIYIPSEWSACDCERSIERRNLTCRSIVGTDHEVDLSTCESFGLPRPVTTRNCTCDLEHRTRKLAQTTTDCGERSCSGNGVCREGICICDPPFEGRDCDVLTDVSIDQDLTCEGEIRINGDCCPSGIYDRGYRCCPRDATIDRDGNCCVGDLDACGVCNGGALFVDAYGTCCETSLDANGFCCPSGNVDECGVCDGFGMTCDFRLTFTVSRPSRSADGVTNHCVENLIGRVLPLRHSARDLSIRHAIDDEDLTVLVPGSLIEFDRTIAAVSRTIDDELHRLNFESIGCGVSHFELISVDRRSVLRNGFCEIGETIFISTSSFSGIFEPGIDWRGIEDCSFVIAACPMSSSSNRPCSGNGICSYAGTATCECFAGYGGEACDECLPGYLFTNGRCLPSGAHPTNVVDHTYSTRNSMLDEEQEEDEGNGRDRQFRVIVSTLFGIGFFIIIAVGCIVYLGWSHHNISHNLVSTGTLPSEMGSRSRASLSDTESREITMTAGSIRTASSGAPIFTKTEPEEVIATPPRRVTDVVDGSDFHGNAMHRPIFGPQSSDALANNPKVMTHCVVDISGQKRQARRMPSPDITEVGSPLFPIQESKSINFDSTEWNPFGASTSEHVRRNSRSLDSPGGTPWLNTFDPWLNAADAERERPETDPSSSRGEQDLSGHRSRSARSLRSRPNDSISSFEFDLPTEIEELPPNPATEHNLNDEQTSETRMTFAQRWRHFFHVRTDQPADITHPADHNRNSDNSPYP